MARSVVQNSFAGSVPRRASHLTPVGQAVRAVDCKLQDGTLSSWREPLLRRTVAEGTRSIYQAHNCCWVESDTCAHFAEGSPELRHVFATNYAGLPYPVRLVFDELCVPTVLRLGLPCPVPRLDVTAPQARTKAAEARSYAYAFVDSLGNQGGLSDATDVILVEDGTPVLLSGWAHPGDGWDVASVAIYRSQAGFESVLKEEANKMDSAWQLVDTVPISALNYTDSKEAIELFDALGSDVVEPPPADLWGITWVQSMNCLVGFSGRQLCFSANHEYHNWPHRMTLDDNIRGIVESNDVIYVATDGPPYVVKGRADCATAGCREALRMPEALPMIGGARGIVEVPSGAVFPTHSGLVHLSGNSAPTILTRELYAPEDWQALQPDTAKIAYYAGRLFVFCRGGAFALSLREGAGTGADTDVHTELSLRPDEVLVTRQGKFYLRTGTAVAEWDRGTAKMPHRYEGPVIASGVPVNFGAGQVQLRYGAERVQILCDGDTAFDETLLVSEHWAMPLWATGRRFQWILSGTGRVESVALAPSTKEL